MKQKLYLSILAAAVLCAIPSCTETAEDYVPADSETGNAFYFASNTATSYTMTEGGSISIPVNRINSDEATSVTLTVEYDESVFEVPASASFDAGAKVSNVNIAYDFDKAVVGQPYTITMKITSETSQYGLDSLSITATSPSQWIDFADPDGKPALVTFATYWVVEDHIITAYIHSYIHYVEDENGVRSCETYNESCVYNGKTYEDTYWGLEDDDHLAFKWYTKNQNPDGYDYIEVSPIVIGYSESRGANIYATDYFHYYYDINGVTKYGTTFLEFTSTAEKAGRALPYYDGNGGFYITLAYPIGATGYWYGEYEDVGIADGYERTTDYNTLSYTEKWSADVDSDFYDDHWSGQKVSICDDDSTIVYLPQYFTDTTGLAFCLRTDETGGLTTETAIEDVANEQYTGVDVFGDRIYVKVKKGEVLEISEEGYPVFSVTLSLYSKRYSEEDSTWTKQTSYPSVTETIAVSGGAWYSADNLSGLEKATYTSYKWLMEATDLFEGKRDYISYVYFEDAGTDSNGYEWLTMTGLSGWGETYWADGDGVDVMWYGGYLYLQSQSKEDAFSYNGSAYSVDVHLLNGTEGSVTEDGYLFGGYSSDDGLVAFTNYPYNDDAVDGVYWYANGLGGLSAWYKIALYPVEAISSSSASIDIAPLGGVSPSGRRSIGKSLAKSSVKSNPAKKEFNLSPVEETPGREKPIERVKNLPLR